LGKRPPPGPRAVRKEKKKKRRGREIVRGRLPAKLRVKWSDKWKTEFWINALSWKKEEEGNKAKPPLWRSGLSERGKAYHKGKTD